MQAPYFQPMMVCSACSDLKGYLNPALLARMQRYCPVVALVDTRLERSAPS